MAEEGVPPPGPRWTEEERSRLTAEFGAEPVAEIEAQAEQIFEALDTEKDGTLSLAEFAAALGQLGAQSEGDGSASLASFMFSAVDSDDSGSIGFFEFCRWKLIMLFGSNAQKLKFGFDLCDYDGNGEITRAELGALLSSIFSVLSGLSLGDHNPEEELFIDSLFGKFGSGAELAEPQPKDQQTLTWGQYLTACTEWGKQLSHLGHTNLSYGGAAASSEEQGTQKQMGKRAFFGQERWEFMLTLMLGLQLAIDRTEKVDETDSAELMRTWTAEREKKSAPQSGSGQPGDDDDEDQEPVPTRTYVLPAASIETESDGGELTQALSAPAPKKMGLFSRTKAKKPAAEIPPPGITVIGGQLFREIRTAFGVSDSDFLGALGIRQVIGGLLMGDLRGLAELVSEGKSGSLFFWSHCGRFMVKTIHADESESLQQMLHAYKDYVTGHTDTLLTKYLGLYSLDVPTSAGSRGTTTHHLVVMANVFNTPLTISERFDLKGSTFGRTVGDDGIGAPGLVHKDLDFKRMQRRIGLADAALVPRLKAQIEQDAEFLCAQSVIDYSVLLGVAARPSDSAMQSAWVAQHASALESAHTSMLERLAGLVDPSTLALEDFAAFAFAHRASEAGEATAVPGGEGGRGDGADCASIFTANYGGLLGSSRCKLPRTVVSAQAAADEVLFVGIIDMLVPWNNRKKMEYQAKKSVLQRGQNFSVIPADEYADRFAKANAAHVCEL